jgi:hypothetical protein
MRTIGPREVDVGLDGGRRTADGPMVDVGWWTLDGGRWTVEDGRWRWTVEGGRCTDRRRTEIYTYGYTQQ